MVRNLTLHLNLTLTSNQKLAPNSSGDLVQILILDQNLDLILVRNRIL